MGEGTGDVVVDRGVRVPMRDGLDLVADVYRVEGGAPGPVLVHRTAYGRSTEAMVSGLIADPAVLAACGYTVVVQDVRGRFGSPGEWVPFEHEMDDGYDTVEWAAAQPWSDGAVGCYGSSYMGITTHLAVAARPPHLKAAAVVVASRDPNDGLLRTGGAFELGFLHRWAVTNGSDTVGRSGLTPADEAVVLAELADVAADRAERVRDVPVVGMAPLDVAAPYWRAWIERPPGHRRWQETWGLPGDVAVPLLSVVGLRDWMQPSMLALWERIHDDGRHRLVAGPWTHLSAYGGPTGQRDLTDVAPGGPAAFGPVIRAWFDRWLRSVAPAVDTPKVRYFATGDDRWVDADHWPPPGERAVLHLDGADPAGDGRLVQAQPGPGGSRRYRYDPADPTPTVGGMICQPDIGPDGIVDQRALDGRADLLGYTSEPLTGPLRVAGPGTVELWFASSAPDTDVMVTLVDVAPDGYAANVTEGILRTRYRLGGTEDWLPVDGPTLLTVRLADSAHTWLEGHRVRLVVASANFPRISRNLNTRTVPELGTLDDAAVADQRVLHGGDHPSRVVLHRIGPDPVEDPAL